MIVDVHTHLWQSPDQLGQQIGAQLRHRFSGPGEPLDASPSAHAEATAPVNAAIVLGFRSVHLGAAVPAKLISNYVATRLDRMVGFAGIDPMEDGYLDQIEQLPAMRLSGVVISPSEQAFHPGHSRALKLFDRCQQLGMPVFVHQGTFVVRDSRMEYAMPHLLDEVARNFPRLKILISHCGYPWIDEALVLIGKHQNIYTELSQVVSRPWQLYNVLLQAHQLGVTDRLLLGSDFPQLRPAQAIEAIYSLNTFTLGSGLPAIPREKLRSIVERDALFSLGLKLPGGPLADAPAPAAYRMSVSPGDHP